METLKKFIFQITMTISSSQCMTKSTETWMARSWNKTIIITGHQTKGPISTSHQQREIISKNRLLLETTTTPTSTNRFQLETTITPTSTNRFQLETTIFPTRTNLFQLETTIIPTSTNRFQLETTISLIRSQHY